MNKTELIKAAAVKAETTQKAMGTYLDAVLEAITESLVNGEDVKLAGFGKFEVTERSARVGHNPSTGEEIDIPAMNVVKFKPALALKEAVK